jgi:DNA-dependent RNA polymerase auxiliary subunit epsilon
MKMRGLLERDYETAVFVDYKQRNKERQALREDLDNFTKFTDSLDKFSMRWEKSQPHFNDDSLNKLAHKNLMALMDIAFEMIELRNSMSKKLRDMNTE